MSRVVALTTLKQGIQRIREKGGADPNTLYDLRNGFVQADGSIASRPGTAHAALLPADTHGLLAIDGAFVVFSHQPKSGLPSGYRCMVLIHPTNAATAIKKVWFAAGVLGYPYVSAEFTDGVVAHYWLRRTGVSATTWEANHAYPKGFILEPGNGYAYVASRLAAEYPAWEPNTTRAVNDVREPTVRGDFKLTVTAVAGATPRSGEYEPAWKLKDGGVTIEWADTAPVPPPPDPQQGGGGGGSGGGGSGGCVVFDSVLDDGTIALDARVGDEHEVWTPTEGFTRQAIKWVGDPILRPCVRITLADGSTLRCSIYTPFTDPYATHDEETWETMDVLRCFNADKDIVDVESIEGIGEQLVVPIDFGGRSFAAGDEGLVWSHNMVKKIDDPKDTP